jgi:hypothetical protein
MSLLKPLLNVNEPIETPPERLMSLLKPLLKPLLNVNEPIETPPERLMSLLKPLLNV